MSNQALSHFASLAQSGFAEVDGALPFGVSGKGQLRPGLCPFAQFAALAASDSRVGSFNISWQNARQNRQQSCRTRHYQIADKSVSYPPKIGQ